MVFLKKTKISAVILLITALFVSVFLPIYFAEESKPLHHLLSDIRQRSQQLDRPVTSVVVIDFDEKSLKELGSWPWSRERYAELIRILIDEYQLGVLAVDMVFPEEKQGDALLAKQLQRKEVVGGVIFDLAKRELPEAHALKQKHTSIVFQSEDPVVLAPIGQSNHASLNYQQIGHITPLFDEDSVLRRIPALLCTDLNSSDCAATLSVATYINPLNSPRLSFRKGNSFLESPWYLQIEDVSSDASKHVLVHQIPLTKHGEIQVPYRHKMHSNWIVISAADILSQRFPKEMLIGSIGFLSGSALGIGDIVATPSNAVSPGYLPHIETLAALLEDEFYYQPLGDSWVVILFLLPFALVLYLLLMYVQTSFLRTISYLSWLCVTISLGLFANFYFLKEYLLDFPIVPVILFPIIALILIFLYQLNGESIKISRFSRLFASYIPKHEANRLMALHQHQYSQQEKVDAQRRLITVMFADVNGFTTICEHHTAETVAQLMHRIFSLLSEIVVKHDGTIDKFIGDAIMVFWNAPLEDELHAKKALLAALEMQERISELSDFCDYIGIPLLKIGIGIESGYALVGNFGSEHRRTYTALGEPVVLASRIEALTKTTGKKVLIGEGCAKLLEGEPLDSLGKVSIRGRNQPIALFSPQI